MTDNELLLKMLDKLESIESKIGALELTHASLEPVIKEYDKRINKAEADISHISSNLAEFKTEVGNRLHSLGNHISTLKVEKKTAWFMVCVVAVVASALCSLVAWAVTISLKLA